MEKSVITNDSLDALKAEITNLLGKNQDFGRGNFYQSLPILNIVGQRDTAERIKLYGLNEIISSEKDVLDIGCNIGFFDLAIAPQVKSIDGIEYNSALVEIGKCVKKYLNYDNVEFLCMDFKNFSTKKLTT